MQCSKFAGYSITFVSQREELSGTLRPRALALLMLGHSISNFLATARRAADKVFFGFEPVAL
jgi:hypothetical protein